jgi:DNA-binding MarR family transcriptional regulator
MKSETAQRQAEMLEVLKQFRLVFGSQKRHYQSVEKSSGVGGAQMWALAEVHRRPGITVGELARRLAIHRSTATNLVNRLDALNLVIKRRNGTDQRNVQLEVTARGAQLFGKTPKPAVGLLQRALLEVPPATLRGLSRNLSVVIRAMQPKAGRARAEP